MGGGGLGLGRILVLAGKSWHPWISLELYVEWQIIFSPAVGMGARREWKRASKIASPFIVGKSISPMYRTRTRSGEQTV